ncbi:MAG: autotransporter-associated beta strand repeat-containing protein, partial [Thermoguttaceae bacterium]|jgi:autotransporter-associated beta strand protein|nr:autotransporter-associated beta strand repeat-containing protein [Thermoguttaceae bacterium]
MDSSVTDPNINRVSNLTVTDTLTVKRGAVGVNSGFSATAGTLDMSGGSIIGLAGNTANTTVHIGNGGLIMSDATLRFGWIWSGILDSPYTIRVNLAGDFTGSGTNSLDYITTLGPRLLDLQVATRTFNITGGTTTISPTIQNGGLTKTGAGALVLSGANTYTGPTTVDAGLLLVNGTHTGGGAYSVHGSGTLGGTGSIGSVVGVGAGGKLAPGASIGTLAIGDHLTLAGGSTFEWEFNSDSLTADLLNVDGDLALLGNVSLDLVDLAAPAGALPVDTKFTLISYSGDWNGGVFEDYANYSTFTSGLNEWRIRYNDVAPDLNGAFGSFVTLRVIPEPSSIVLLLAAVFGLLLRRRARFSRNRAPAYP